MSKQWYYEVMGSPVGPITSAELKACVLTRRILPETRIRLGEDGKWQTADHVKGLFDGAPPPAPKSPAPAKAHAEEKVLVAQVVRPKSALLTDFLGRPKSRPVTDYLRSGISEFQSLCSKA